MSSKAFHKGIFPLKHPEKYKGTLPVVFRSSLEMRVYRWLDQSSHVISWGSESVVIPYFDPIRRKKRRYFIDVNAEIKTKDGRIEKVLLEIKPAAQTRVPQISPRQSIRSQQYALTTWVTNQAKWTAAKEWALKNNYKFTLLTEEFFKGSNL